MPEKYNAKSGDYIYVMSIEELRKLNVNITLIILCDAERT